MTSVGSCPKHMIFGPCGGVRADGGCEMVPMPCVFDDAVGAVDVTAAVPLTEVPLVLTDVSAPPFDAAALQRIATTLLPACDAVLVGEHHNRPDFPPTLIASLLLAMGARPWVTLACRDRNRVVLEQELRGLRHVGVDTVLCVTGDGRGPDVRPDVTQVWDLDGPRLAELAASVGLTAAVPETPTSPPVSARPGRLVAKQDHGAAVAVLNHVARTDEVAEFMARARDQGLRVPVIAGVATFTDAGSAAALQNLPGLEIEPSTVDHVLSSADPVEAGIAAAVQEARTLLAIDGIEGVNVSGLASTRGWHYAAEVKAEIGLRIRAELV